MQQVILTTHEELTLLIKSVIDPYFQPAPSLKPLPSTSKPKYLTRKEVCALYSITYPTLDKHTASGLFKAIHIGRRVLYDEQELLSSFQNTKAIIVQKGKTN